MFFDTVKYTLTEDSLTCPDDKNIGFLDNPRSIFFFIALATLAILVAVGNSIVVSAVYITVRMRTVTGIIITSLAIADLLVGLIVLPFSATLDVHKIWFFGATACEAWLIMDVWLGTSSILNICSIAIDRYLAITKPMEYSAKMTTMRAKSLVVTAWIVSFLVASLPIVLWSDERVRLDAETRLPSDFMPTRGPENETIGNITDIAEFLDLVTNVTEETLQTLYSTEFVSYIKQERARRVSNSTEFPKIFLSKEKYVCPYSCELSNYTRYVLFSAIASHYLPVSLLLFCYWKIYTVARRARKAKNRGYLKNNGIDEGEGCVVSLRLHRGGQGKAHTGFQKKNGIDPPKKSFSQLERTQSLKTKKNATATEETSFIDQPIPSTSNGETGSRSGTDKNNSRPVRPRRAKNKTLPKSGRKKKWLYRTKVSYNAAYVRKRKNEEEPGCDIELPESAESTSPPLSTESSGRDKGDSVETTDTSENGRMPRNYFRKVMRFFYNPKCREKVRKFYRETKTERTIALVLGCALGCWAPFFAFYVTRGFCVSCVSADTFTLVFWLGYINSALNPFVYAVMSNEYNEAFKQIRDTLLCRKKPRKVMGTEDKRKEKKYYRRVKELYTKKQSPILQTTELDPQSTGDASHISRPKTTITYVADTTIPPKTTTRVSLATKIPPKARRSASLFNMTTPETTKAHKEPTAIQPKTRSASLFTMPTPESAKTLMEPTEILRKTRSASVLTCHTPEITKRHTGPTTSIPETPRSASMFTMSIQDTTPTHTEPATTVSRMPSRTSLFTMPETTIPAKYDTTAIPETTVTSPHVITVIPETAATDTQIGETVPSTTKIIPVTTRGAMRGTRDRSGSMQMDIVLEIPPKED